MALTPQQRAVALRLERYAMAHGASPQQAREFAAAAYSESDLIPTATNKSSGAAGLLQLLSSGYREKAQQLGGLYGIESNAGAIWPDYQSYWKEHPSASPGEAAAAVERSGEGADFYTKGLGLIPSPGGAPAPLPTDPAYSPGHPSFHPAVHAMVRSAFDPNSEALHIASSLAAGTYNPVEEVTRLQQARTAAPQEQSPPEALPPKNSPPVSATPAAPPPQPAVTPQKGKRTSAGGGFIYPLGAPAKMIGFPYQGTHTMYGNWESDNAVDLAVPVGTPVYATRAGVIGSQIGALNSSDPHLLGLRLHLQTKNNEFYYAHLSQILVKAGQRVRAGQLLGYSGEANGVAHLHLASRVGNPEDIYRR